MALPRNDPLTNNIVMRDTSPPPRAVFPGTEMAKATPAKGAPIHNQNDAMGFVNNYHNKYFEAGPKYTDQFMNHSLVKKFPAVQKRAMELHREYFKRDYIYKKGK